MVSPCGASPKGCCRVLLRRGSNKSWDEVLVTGMPPFQLKDAAQGRGDSSLAAVVPFAELLPGLKAAYPWELDQHVDVSFCPSVDGNGDARVDYGEISDIGSRSVPCHRAPDGMMECCINLRFTEGHPLHGEDGQLQQAANGGSGGSSSNGVVTSASSRHKRAATEWGSMLGNGDGSRGPSSSSSPKGEPLLVEATSPWQSSLSPTRGAFLLADGESGLSPPSGAALPLVAAGSGAPPAAAAAAAARTAAALGAGETEEDEEEDDVSAALLTSTESDPWGDGNGNVANGGRSAGISLLKRRRGAPAAAGAGAAAPATPAAATAPKERRIGVGGGGGRRASSDDVRRRMAELMATPLPPRLRHKGRAQQRARVKTVDDLRLYAEFVGPLWERYRPITGYRQAIGELVGMSCNRLGELKRLWEAATHEYGDHADVARKLKDPNAQLCELIQALRAAGWKKGARPRNRKEDEEAGDGSGSEDDAAADASATKAAPTPPAVRGRPRGSGAGRGRGGGRGVGAVGGAAAAAAAAMAAAVANGMTPASASRKRRAPVASSSSSGILGAVAPAAKRRDSSGGASHGGASSSSGTGAGQAGQAALLPALMFEDSAVSSSWGLGSSSDGSRGDRSGSGGSGSGVSAEEVLSAAASHGGVPMVPETSCSIVADDRESDSAAAEALALASLRANQPTHTASGGGGNPAASGGAPVPGAPRRFASAADWMAISSAFANSPALTDLTAPATSAPANSAPLSAAELLFGKGSSGSSSATAASSSAPSGRGVSGGGGSSSIFSLGNSPPFLARLSSFGATLSATASEDDPFSGLGGGWLANTAFSPMVHSRPLPSQQQHLQSHDSYHSINNHNNNRGISGTTIAPLSSSSSAAAVAAASAALSAASAMPAAARNASSAPTLSELSASGGYAYPPLVPVSSRDASTDSLTGGFGSPSLSTSSLMGAPLARYHGGGGDSSSRGPAGPTVSSGGWSLIGAQHQQQRAATPASSAWMTSAEAAAQSTAW